MLSQLILIPLAALLVLNIPLWNFMKRLSFGAALLIGLAQIALVIFWPSLLAGCPVCPISASMFSFTLAADSLSLVMLLSIGIVMCSALLVGWWSIEDLTKRFDFTNLLLLALIGMNGLVMVQDLFSLYVFLEIIALSTFILIAFYKDKESLEGAFKYLILSAIATVLMLSSIALLMMLAGDTSFATVSAMLKSQNNLFTAIAVAIFMGGLLIKGGLVPFHGWLPDAYSSAPASVSVLLAGIVTKTTGIYTVIRLVSAVFGFTAPVKEILLLAGAVSILVGAFAALGQKDMKRMLAYSSISQMGYIILSLGTGTALGIAGAVFHLFNHAIFKTQLFVNAAAVEEETKTRDMDKLGGIAAKMPVTGATSVVAFLSTAGIPPLSGFWSKLIIIIALWTAGYKMYAAIAVAASLVTVAYFLSMQRRVFFGKLAQGFENLKEAKAGILVPAVLLAIITIGVGLFFPYVLNTFILPVKSITG